MKKLWISTLESEIARTPKLETALSVQVSAGFDYQNQDFSKFHIRVLLGFVWTRLSLVQLLSSHSWLQLVCVVPDLPPLFVLSLMMLADHGLASGEAGRGGCSQGVLRPS